MYKANRRSLHGKAPHQCHQLHKRYRQIEIPLRNEVYGIVGNNGSGKSTIMALLSEHVPPYSYKLTNVHNIDKFSLD